MGTQETNILRRVWKAASARGWTLFRNNVGLFRSIESEARIQCGLCRGSADLVGWRTVTITPEHVGQRIAQFTAIEVKTPKGRVSREQRQWLGQAEEAGALVIVARSPEDLHE